LIKENNYKTYLEIGVFRGESFKEIVCEIKDSVDPYISDTFDFLTKSEEYPVTYRVTSDYFFENIAPTLKYKYDIIFIDGLHLSEQVDKDIDNSLKYLNENGTIVLHDCNPKNYDIQIVPRIYDYWSGDVWKSIVKLKNRSDLDIFVIDSDTGLGVIKKTKNKLIKTEIIENLTWEYFDKNRKELLNLISDTDFLLSIYKERF
jgi:hypothetical protein